MYIFEELKKSVKNKLSKFLVYEIKMFLRTRSEKKECKESILAWLKKYVDCLWVGISKREGIFSILGYIIEHKPSLSVKHMIELIYFRLLEPLLPPLGGIRTLHFLKAWCLPFMKLPGWQKVQVALGGLRPLKSEKNAKKLIFP